jgi:hypothetical protein
MSWFNRKPRVREPEHVAPKHFSPIAEKLLKEQKELVRGTAKKKNDK